MTRNEQLQEIASQVQQWLDWQEKERDAEGLLCDDGTHMMRVPVWPTRGQLKSWVAVLKTPNAELSGPRPLAAEGSRSNAGLEGVPATEGPFATTEELSLALGAEPEEAKQLHTRLEFVVGGLSVMPGGE